MLVSKFLESEYDLIFITTSFNLRCSQAYLKLHSFIICCFITHAWEQRKLKEIINKVTNKNKKKEFSETLTNSAEYGIVSQLDYFDKDISNKNNLNNYYIVEPDDFVYNPRISSYAPVGPINRNNLGRTGVMSPLYYIFKVHGINKTYLEKYFSSVKWHDFMKKNGDTGARADRFSIKADIFITMPIPVPTGKEQDRIGNLLKLLDNLIAANQDKVDQLKKVKKLLMQKIFDQEWRFTGFTDPWEQRKLNEVLVVHSGRDYKHLSKGNIPVYGTGGFMLGVNDKLSDKDAVGIGRKGTINAPQLLIAPFWTVDTLFFLIPQKKFDLLFIYAMSQQINWKGYDESTGVPSLSKKTIENINRFVPPIREQIKIGSFFSNMNNLIAANQRSKKTLIIAIFIIIKKEIKLDNST
ncbi:restriction endonuclease subunit S [Paucilactobacillus kaifaensis]|uniref:restriction endonuclease subunit S n=1 Tax=Paucilactobacillus kaifaensis TaxID=2559921 RepID=UPI0010F45592|nr:restriction endonuclease subunit S [Paucilactobacillus kaifaensis]